MHWSAGFVGLPYADCGRTRAGADCWGLYWLVQKEAFGRDVPTYAGAYACSDERAEIHAVIGEAMAHTLWERTFAPEDGDAVVFSLGRFDAHVGVFAGPGRMLHMAGSGGALIEDFTRPKWASRLIGFWRWRGE